MYVFVQVSSAVGDGHSFPVQRSKFRSLFYGDSSFEFRWTYARACDVTGGGGTSAVMFETEVDVGPPDSIGRGYNRQWEIQCVLAPLRTK